jgi:hypothetical protein
MITPGATAVFSTQTSTNQLHHGWKKACSPGQWKRQLPSSSAFSGTRRWEKPRVDVHLRFTHKQTYCCGYLTAYEHYQGIVTVILESNRWVIDDFVAFESGALLRLSDGYPECKGGQWVELPGEPSY